MGRAILNGFCTGNTSPNPFENDSGECGEEVNILPLIDVLEVGKMGMSKNLSKSAKGHIVMAGRPGHNISCSQSAVDRISCGSRCGLTWLCQKGSSAFIGCLSYRCLPVRSKQSDHSPHQKAIISILYIISIYSTIL